MIAILNTPQEINVHILPQCWQVWLCPSNHDDFLGPHQSQTRCFRPKKLNVFA